MKYLMILIVYEIETPPKTLQIIVSKIILPATWDKRWENYSNQINSACLMQQYLVLFYQHPVSFWKGVSKKLKFTFETNQKL